ncbi:MAG: hypothetical protein CL927_16780 [Deltaproteobacteria bacterium]|nr:hypothetical protein [Deltaproteobacteria bacterium]
MAAYRSNGAHVHGGGSRRESSALREGVVAETPPGLSWRGHFLECRMTRMHLIFWRAAIAVVSTGCGGLYDYGKLLDTAESESESESERDSGDGAVGAADTGFTGGTAGGSGDDGSSTGDAGSDAGGDAGGDAGSDAGGGDGEPGTIAVDGVTPDYGSTIGGDTVVIEGGPFDESTRVLMARTEATVLSYTETSITVSTPAVTMEGSVAIQVESDTADGVLLDAFRYWADGTGVHGMIGYVQLARYTGTYWTPSVPDDEYFAQVYFTEPTPYRWYDIVVPSLDTCRSELWTTSAVVNVFTAGVSTLSLQPTSGSTLQLALDGFAYLAQPSSLTAGARYSLLSPIGGDLPEVDVADVFRLPSSSPTVYSPAINSSEPPFISQYETFQWAPSGADWVEISINLSNGATSTGAELVTCAVYDDGSFTFDGSQFSSWPSSTQAIISVGFVYDDSSTVLPWNRSTSAIAGVMKTVGGAFTY